MFWKKKIETIKDSTPEQIEAVETWRVDWESRYGEYSGNTRAECEFFTDEATAKRFADDLRAAFKLIRHTSGTGVRCRPNRREGDR